MRRRFPGARRGPSRERTRAGRRLPSRQRAGPRPAGRRLFDAAGRWAPGAAGGAFGAAGGRALGAVRSRGFTALELVVVIVIIGVLAAVAAPRFFDDRPFLERGYYEELVAALKHAQKLAIASGCPVRVNIDATGYAASQQRAIAGRCDPADASWSTPVRLAGGQTLSGSTPDGVAVSPAATLTFDALGRTGLGADRTIAVGPFALTVAAESGYVRAQ